MAKVQAKNMKKIKDDYLSNPLRCPVCGSEDISGEGIYSGDGTIIATQIVNCNTCGVVYFLKCLKGEK